MLEQLSDQLTRIEAALARIEAQLAPGAMSIAELAAHLGVCDRTVTRYVAAGMPYSQPGGPGGRVLIDPAKAKEWLDGHEQTRMSMAGYRPRTTRSVA